MRTKMGCLFFVKRRRGCEHNAFCKCKFARTHENSTEKMIKYEAQKHKRHSQFASTGCLFYVVNVNAAKWTTGFLGSIVWWQRYALIYKKKSFSHLKGEGAVISANSINTKKFWCWRSLRQMWMFLSSERVTKQLGKKIHDHFPAFQIESIKKYRNIYGKRLTKYVANILLIYTMTWRN